MNKSELLRAFEETHRHSLEILLAADPQQVIYQESGWRVKDILAHVATWDAEALRSFHTFRRGGAYSTPNFESVDDFNAFAAHARLDQPVEHIMADWDATRTWLRLIFNAMSDEDFSSEMTYPSGRRGTARALAQEIIEHQAEHIDHIRAALTLP